MNVFSYNNLVFTVSHKNLVLKLERIIQYLFLFGCPFHSRECYLLFHFLKGVVLRRHVLPSIILWIKWGQRQGSWERVSLRSSPMVAFVGWRNTNSTTGQSQRKLTCLILSLRGRRLFSFHLFPRAQIFGLRLTNKILSGPNSGLWLS